VKAGEGIVEYLEEVKEEVRTRETLEKVALVASNHDRNIGGLVAEAISRVGPSGSILIEAGNT
jgi:chaperonin GroEL